MRKLIILAFLLSFSLVHATEPVQAITTPTEKVSAEAVESANAKMLVTLTRQDIIDYLTEVGFTNIYPPGVNPKPNTAYDWYVVTAFWQGQHYHVTVYCNENGIIDYSKVLY